MSHPRCVYRNNRRGYQSITQQYLKKMFNIKDEVNYMFRPKKHITNIADAEISPS